LPVKFFVVNNGGYASIRSSQLNHFQGRHIACDSASGLYLASIGKLAAAYGLPFHQINAESDLASTIQQVLDAEGPIICEVVVRPDEPRIPRLSSSVRSDGSMVSRPLEDLYPFLDREEFMENMMVPPLPESVGN
jgi:acetolactate synthase-1/2/3 large subunit